MLRNLLLRHTPSWVRLGWLVAGLGAVGCHFDLAAQPLALLPVAPPPVVTPQLKPSPLGADYLAHLVTLAVTSHPTVQARAAELGGSRAGIDAAKWQYYPTPTILTERSSNQAKSGSTLAGSTGTTTLRLQQPIWSGGRLDATLRVSEFKNLASQMAVSEARLSVAMRTVEAWQGLLTAQGRKVAAQNVQEKLKNLNQMMDRRVAQQVSPSVEAELSRSRSMQAQAEVVNATVAYESAKFRLEQWVGDLSVVRLRSTALDEAMLQKALQEPAADLPPDVAAQLLGVIEQHPSMLRLDAEMGSAQADVKLKQAELLPTVYVRLDRQFSDNPNTTGRLADTVAYMGLQYTLGAGLSLRSQVEVALAKLQSMQSERETTRREVKERFESELRDFRSALQRVEQAELVLKSSTALLESYERLFVVGRRSWLELLNAVKEAGAAEQAKSDLQAQIHTGYYRLRVYLGEWPWQQGG